MEKPINLLIINMKQDILKIINSNEYNLPITIKQMVINEIKQSVDIATQNVLNQEIEQYKNKLKENENIKNESEEIVNE